LQKDLLPSRQMVHACTHMDSCTELWAQHAVAGWFTTTLAHAARLYFFPFSAFAHQIHQMYCILSYDDTWKSVCSKWQGKWRQAHSRWDCMYHTRVPESFFPHLGRRRPRPGDTVRYCTTVVATSHCNRAQPRTKRQKRLNGTQKWKRAVPSSFLWHIPWQTLHLTFDKL